MPAGADGGVLGRRSDLVIPAKAGIATIQDDELAEVTPQSIRLRKRYLDPHERKKMACKEGYGLLESAKQRGIAHGVCVGQRREEPRCRLVAQEVGHCGVGEQARVER